MSTDSSSRKRFTFEEARAALPAVKALTADAVQRVEALAGRMDTLGPDDDARERIGREIGRIAQNWANSLREMGVEAKGLWLVDFDNGEGYYCWCYPERQIAHYHGYEDGFAGRVKIV